VIQDAPSEQSQTTAFATSSASPIRPSGCRRADLVGALAVVAGERLQRIGPGPGGRHAVHADAVRREIDRLVPRDLPDRRLGRRVEHPAGVRELAGDAREVDDRPAAARAHERRDEPRQDRAARDVHVERAPPLLARRFEAVIEEDHRAVDQEVDAAETRRGGVDERRELGVVRDVGPNECGPLAQAAGRRRPARLVDVGDDDRRARGMECPRDCRAEQRRAAGDERDLAVEVEPDIRHTPALPASRD